MSSLTAKLAALLLAFICADSAWGATTQVSTLAELTDAITAASADDTIKLTADCSMTAYIEVNKNITLDLNGQTLAGGYNMFYVTSGKLTIQDTSEGASGVYTSSAGNGDYNTAPSGYKGAVTLRGGSFELKSGTVNGSSYAVRTAQGSGTITVSGGTLTGMYPIYDGQGTYGIEVTGGKLTTSFSNASAIHKTTAGSVTISGGEIEALGNSTINTSCVKCGQYGSGSALLTITGGTFNAPYGCLVEMGTGKLTVTDINVTKVGYAPFYNCDKIDTASRVSAGDYTSAGYRPTLKAGTLDGGSFRKQDAAYIIDYLVDGYEAYVDTYADVLPEARAGFDTLADYNGKAFFLRDADVTEFFTNRDPYNNPHQTVTIYRDANFNLSRIYTRLGDTMTVRVADNATYGGNVTFEGEPYHPEMYLDVTGPTSENGFTTTTYTLKEHPFVTLYTDGNRESEGVSYGTVKSAINTIATGNTDALIVAEEGIAYLSAVVDGSNKSFTYDLNGQQITGSAYNIFLNPRGNGSVVNVIDSVGTAHVKSTYNFTSTGLIGDNYKIGTLNVHGGEYTANIVISIGEYYSPVFNIDGGTYNGKVNMANGTLHISGNSIFNGVFTLNNTAIVNITGGYFNEAAYYSLKDSANVTLPEGKALVKATGEYADYYTVGIAPAYVAQIGDDKYATLAAALAAVQDGDTIKILAAEISEGSVKFPATLKNVTIKSADGVTATLKDMTLNSADGSAVDYEGITIDGLVFNNSRLLFTGQRTGEVVYKDWAVVNCTFLNIVNAGSLAAIHLGSFSVNKETMDGFTFTNNVINGISGSNNSGLLISACSGNILIEHNIITNVAFNALQLQNLPEGSTLTITNNYLSSAGSGVVNLNASVGTIKIAENAIVNSSNRDGIRNVATSIDVSNNYWGGGEPTFSSVASGKEVTSSSYYSTLTWPADWFELANPVSTLPVAKIDETMYRTLAAAVSAAQPGDTIELLADIEIGESITFYSAGTYVIDGKSHTIRMADGASFGDYGAIEFGAQGANAADIPNKSYTIRNATFTGFNSEIIRAEGCTIAFDGCTFTGNNISLSAGGRGKHLLRLAGVAVTVEDCVFSNNSAEKVMYIDEQSASTATINISDNLFTGNVISGNGLVHVAAAGSNSDAVVNNTFSGNALTNSDNIAVIYISAPVENVSGNLFTSNTVVATAANKKEGVIVLGSGATDTVINNNAFVDNTLGTTTSHYATIYTGADCNVNGNYWGDGAAAEIEDHKDVYDSGTHTIANSTYAESYAVNESGKGVTVTLYVPPVAQIVGGDTYATLQEAVDAASEMTGAVTITLLADAAEKVDITQKANLSLTIDGDGKTLTGQLRVTDDSANDTDRTGALTITGFNFTGTADDVNPNESYVFFERNAYAHNIVVTNCAFTSIDVSTAKSGRPAVKGLALGIETITLVDLQAQNVHSLAQLFDVTNAVIARCNLSAAKNGININFGGAASGNNGVATISDSTINPDVSGSYGVRLQGPNYGTLRILDGQ